MSAALEAHELVNGDRAKSYGPIREDFARTCALFKLMTGIDMTPEQGVTFLMCVKLSRQANGHKHDNLVDLCGYADKLDAMLEGKE